MTLQQWLDNSWIIKIEPSARDVSSLLAIAAREIADASLSGMSCDGMFEHAYAAIRTLCEVALHATGYGAPKGNRQHERIIESLKFTLGDHWAAEVDFLHRARRLRHQLTYDHAGVVQQKDAVELLETAKRLDAEVRDWLRDHHGDLL